MQCENMTSTMAKTRVCRICFGSSYPGEVASDLKAASSTQSLIACCRGPRYVLEREQRAGGPPASDSTNVPPLPKKENSDPGNYGSILTQRKVTGHKQARLDKQKVAPRVRNLESAINVLQNLICGNAQTTERKHQII